MSGAEHDVERARAEALRARARLAETMGEIQERLSPHNLMNEAWQEVRERGQDIADRAVHLARARPVATSAIAAGVIALFAREPIWRALAALIFHRRETVIADEGLKAQDEPSALAGAEVSQAYEEVA